MPLETLVAVVGLPRARGAGRVAILGVPEDAGTAPLTEVHEPRVDVVVTPVPLSWTWRGHPLP
ncbi:hypothetical protein IM697_03105 [Streptomyces ferrugineus]|uniref:Uncharacterized protein n=1 Tax=Streptomyces ferrugineus TaxID=1413221 RepID=A0A7M2SME9_9ACTN|nr:hypothetical protein [Streptomyces ferrugineus]QOV37442.1 hypothetical protein IM697_03105 [Streptomyces ferrugineus]